MAGPFISCIIGLLLTSGVISNRENEWIDPHDMNMGDVQFRPSSAHECKSRSECPPTESLLHYRRLINSLLNLVESDGSNYVGRLNLKLSQEDYKFLLRFVTDKERIENKALLNKIERVMNKVLMKSRLDYLADIALSWTDYVYLQFVNRTTAIIGSCLFLLLISYKLLRASITLWSVTKYLLFLAWVADFAFTWIGLLQEAEINQMSDRLRYESVPPYCDPNKMSWWQYIVYSWSSSSECREYHNVLYKDTFYSIAPLQVISRQLGIVLYTPAGLAGKAIGSFVSGMLVSLPWGLNVVLLPALLIFTLVIICMLLSFSTKTSFGFNVAYLIQFHFGSRERQAVGDTLSGANLSALINTMHRNMIENVSPQTTNEDEQTETSTSREESDDVKDENVPKVAAETSE